MQVSNHGGRCCGVKHIHGFPWRPSDSVCALSKCQVHHGAASEMYHPGQSFYPGGDAMERADIRLDKILKYCDAKKKSHLYEVVLNLNIANHWRKTLEARGFKEVSKFINSNTQSALVVFHRITPLPEKEKSVLVKGKRIIRDSLGRFTSSPTGE